VRAANVHYFFHVISLQCQTTVITIDITTWLKCWFVTFLAVIVRNKKCPFKAVKYGYEECYESTFPDSTSPDRLYQDSIHKICTYVSVVFSRSVSYPYLWLWLLDKADLCNWFVQKWLILQNDSLHPDYCQNTTSQGSTNGNSKVWLWFVGTCHGWGS